MPFHLALKIFAAGNRARVLCICAGAFRLIRDV